MATDAAGHTTPGASDAPKRAAFLDLSLSIRDPIPVADASARSAALSALAGSTPAVTPSSSRPVFFHQADLPKPYRTIWTQDGTNFISTSGHYVWDDATARAAATGAAAGDLGVQLDTKVIYRYDGSAWIPASIYCVLGKNANQNVGTSEVAIVWETEISDLCGMHEPSTNPSRITVPTSGVYEITVSIYYGATSGFSTARARKNGSTFLEGSLDRRPGDTNAGTPMKIAFTAALTAGDYVEILLKHSATTFVLNGNSGTELAPTATVRYLGPS